jgi:hypothetical protein
VAEALATHFGKGDFDAALVADHAAMLHALVLAAEALPVGDRAEDARAEKPVALRLEGAVVNGLGFSNLTMRPAPDLLRGSQHDADCVEVSNWAGELEWVRTEQGVPPWRVLSATAPRLFPGFLEDPSFPGSGGYRFQKRILKSASSS